MSSRKNIIQPVQIVTEGDMSGDVISDPFRVDYVDNVFLQVVWTGAPVGSFTIEGNLSYSKAANFNVNPIVVPDGTWTSLTFTPDLTAPSGSDGDFIAAVPFAPGTIFRIKYTSTSGTGSLNVWLCAKEV